MNLDVDLPNAASTETLGRRLAAGLPTTPGGLLMTLSGELGAGKSSLVRAFLHALGHEGPVPSPTYTLVEPYVIDNHNFYHVDLYRIGGPDELEFLGWDDIRLGTVLVEWPERVARLAPSADLAIELAYQDAGRRASMRAQSPQGKEWLESVRMT